MRRLLSVALAIRKQWWRLRKPRTYGVKVLLIHPASPSSILVVRHSYDDKNWWALPGGGYNPRWERSEEAASREIREELSLELLGPPVVLETLVSRLEGKVDTLTLFVARAANDKFTLSSELSEARWIDQSLDDLPANENRSRWLLRATDSYRARN